MSCITFASAPGAYDDDMIYSGEPSSSASSVLALGEATMETTSTIELMPLAGVHARRWRLELLEQEYHSNKDTRRIQQQPTKFRLRLIAVHNKELAAIDMTSQRASPQCRITQYVHHTQWTISCCAAPATAQHVLVVGCNSMRVDACCGWLLARGGHAVAHAVYGRLFAAAAS
eukprot:262640-Pleurochrysis_carterae.AAC.4